MTIHISMNDPEISKGRNQLDYTVTLAAPHGTLGSPVFAYATTRAEAEQAKRAFENVLAPRFTRDEAIAIVRQALKTDDYADYPEWLSGVRQTLEALAAAGVFSDQPCAETCNPRTCRNNMTAKLDAAGIR